MLERREWVRANCDHLRTALMLEPRGHADMYGALLTEPERPDSDAGVLFMHNEGYSTMCGHGVIAVVTMAHRARADRAARRQRRDRARFAGGADTGARRDSPRRRSDARRARQLRQRAVVHPPCGGARFDSAPARFAPTWRSAARSTRSWTPSRPAWPSGPEHLGELRRAGMAIKHAVEAAVQVVHPTSLGCTGSTGPSSPGRRRRTRRICGT